jgi:hypothetical protein
LADILGVEKLFEELRLVQPPQDAGFLILGEAGLVARGLHPLLQPAPDFRVLNVDVFDPDPTTVGLAQALDHIPQLHLPDVQVVADIVDLVQVLLRQAKFRESQPRGRAGRLRERIEVRLGMSNGAVVVDETVNLRLLQAVDLTQAGGRGGGGTRGPRRGARTARTEGKALEKGVPRRIDGVGILEPRGIGRVDDIGIGPGWQREGVHGLRLENKPSEHRRGTWIHWVGYKQSFSYACRTCRGRQVRRSGDRMD